MPKLVSHEDDVLTYEVLRHWTQDGHEVAWMRLTNKEAPESASAYLMCECDFDEEDYVRDGKVVGKIRRNDPHKCEAKKAVRDSVMREAHDQNADAWTRMSLKEAVLDIKRRVDGREWLGQHYDSMIYTQEVAELLGRPHGEVLSACGELYAEERLDLNGRILAEYVPGFRFPSDMQTILRYVVEEPLGWPNGDAGDCWLAGFEREVQERTGFASGKAAFGKHWPNIDLLILAECGLEPAAKALRAFVAAHPSGADVDILGGVLECMQDGAIAGLQPRGDTIMDIKSEALAEFHRGILQLSFERIEIDRQMRTVKVPPSETLSEMAEYFEKLAVICRDKAKKA